jgi:hypothetical protein
MSSVLMENERLVKYIEKSAEKQISQLKKQLKKS